MSRDPRTQKTRTKIENCLIQLLEKHSFQEITVKMITETCQINRSTFYRNYEDKYSLIAQVACRLLEEYQTALQPDFIILTDPDIVRLRPYFLPLIEFGEFTIQVQKRKKVVTQKENSGKMVVARQTIRRSPNEPLPTS